MISSSLKKITTGLLVCFFFALLPLHPLAEDAPPPEETPAEAEELLPVRPAGEGQGIFLPPFEPTAASVCMFSANSGQYIYEKNADAPVVSASLVKMMTAILVMDNVGDIDGEIITANQDWVFDQLYGMNASLADIKKGESLTVREMLYAMLLPSGNEAALFLADYVSGGYMQNFLFMMQTRAAELGCTATTFVDPNGLSEGNITTARDMCLIVQEFCRYPALVEIASTPTYEMAAHEGHAAPYNLFNTNRLLVSTSPYYNPVVKVGKTGSLGEWQNFASMAETEEARYFCVVMNSPNEADALGASFDVPQARPALYETSRLYEWAFTNLSVQPALDTALPITEVPLRYCMEQNTLLLLPSSDLQALLPTEAAGSNIQLDMSFDVPEYVEAPIEAGDVVGSVTVSLTLDGELMGAIGTADLVATESAQRNNTLYVVRRVQEFFGSTYFKVLLGVVAFAVLAYIGTVVLIGLASEQKTGRKRRRK